MSDDEALPFCRSNSHRRLAPSRLASLDGREREKVDPAPVRRTRSMTDLLRPHRGAVQNSSARKPPVRPTLSQPGAMLRR
jgi:hypothetical protein